MRRRRRFWARTTPVFRCMTERDVSMGLHRRFIKAAWSTAVEILRKVKRTWGCCTTAMEPRSPPPLWPVSNAFSTPWTPHPVDGPARRATMNFPSRRKATPSASRRPHPVLGGFAGKWLDTDGEAPAFQCVHRVQQAFMCAAGEPVDRDVLPLHRHRVVHDHVDNPD